MSIILITTTYKWKHIVILNPVMEALSIVKTLLRDTTDATKKIKLYEHYRSFKCLQRHFCVQRPSKAITHYAYNHICIKSDGYLFKDN